jgi:lipoate-protein ligase A
MAEIQAALVTGFAERLGISPARGEITAEEEALAAKHHDEEIGTEAFVHEIDDPGADASVRSGTHTGAGGTVTAYLRLEGAGPQEATWRVREALITGDFFVTPPRVVFDLEASLRGVPVAEAGAAVERFFAGARVGLLTVAPADFRAAVENALGASLVEKH